MKTAAKIIVTFGTLWLGFDVVQIIWAVDRIQAAATAFVFAIYSFGVWKVLK